MLLLFLAHYLFNPSLFPPDQVDCVIRMQKDSFMAGEPPVFIFEIRNRSRQDIFFYTMGQDYHRYGKRRDGVFKAVIGLENGGEKQTIDLVNGSAQMAQGQTRQIRIAAGRTYRKAYCLSYYNDLLHTPGRHVLEVERAVLISEKNLPFDQLDGLAETMVHRKATFEVIPADQEKMGRLIDTWGKAWLAGDEFSGYLLDGLKDERVIPYCVAMVESKDKDGAHEAVNILTKFTESDAAFHELKKIVMNAASGENSGEDSISYPDGLRNWTLGAMSGFKQADMLPMLLTLKNDPHPGIRSRTLRMLPDFDPAEARTAARELQTDSNTYVRKAALEVLEKVKAPERPCDQAGMPSWFEISRDTARLGDTVRITFVLHNCTGKTIRIERGGGDTYPQSGMDVFEVQATHIATGNSCLLSTHGFACGRGMIGFVPVLPGDLFRQELVLNDWAAFKEPGAYEVTITRQIVLSPHKSYLDPGYNPANNTKSAAGQRFRLEIIGE
jgi:hypothetical protein